MTRASGHRNGAGNRVTVYERVTERVTELLSAGRRSLAETVEREGRSAPQRGVRSPYYRGLNVFHAQPCGV